MKFPNSFFVPLTLAVALLISGCQSIPVKSSHADTIAPTPALTTPKPVPTETESGVYVFGWGELPAATAKPRGGSSRGAPVTLAPAQALPLATIAQATTAFERDRAAILSLAGDYKVSFHFMETLGLTTNYQPQKSYYSWATEHVRVIEDTGRFVSLQHTLVMFTKKDDGTISEPMVMKHWRQDWSFEPTELHTFRGDNTWERRRPSAAESAGAWSQAVFQVDDSPRYAALGRWEHRGNLSVWNGEREWRPLPRREHTVRKDYGVMEGNHRIVITPTGWLHEQLNWKRVAGDPAAVSYVGEEWGLDRYERITSPSLVAGDNYWRKTGLYWAAVRKAWADTFAQKDLIKLRPQVGGKKLFEEHFAYADKIDANHPYNTSDGEQHAKSTIAAFIE